MSKLLYGVGSTDGLKCRLDGSRMTHLYTLWSNMLSRCYGTKTQSRQPSYVGCEVSDNFKSFKFFTEWCNVQIGYGTTDSKGRVYSLDKDLLFKGNKLYSEDTCVFIPQEVNSAISSKGNQSGGLPLGVKLKPRHKNKVYASYITKFGVNKCLINSDSIEECFLVYKKEKEIYLKELANMFKGNIDVRAYNALINYEVNKGI